MNRCLWKLVNAAKNGFDAAWQQLRNVADYDARGFQVLEPVAMASGLSSSKNIEIVVAVIADANGRILMVRKRDTKALIHPGGKRRPGERALDTLARELREELGVELLRPSVRRLGLFEERAANEPGRRVCAEAFAAKIAGTPQPQSEIAELLWIDPRRPPQNIAPMSRCHILPAWRQAR